MSPEELQDREKKPRSRKRPPPIHHTRPYSLTNVVGWLGDLLVGSPGPKLAATRARFEEMPGAGAVSRTTNWPEPKFGMLVPILPAVLFAAVMLLALAFIFPGEIPILAPRSRPPAYDPQATVLVHKDTGFYACAGTKFFGGASEEKMTQEKALSRGYQPVGGAYCTSSAIR